jgi:hypothetical protein
MRIALSLSALLLSSVLYAESLDEALEGFDEPTMTTPAQEAESSVEDEMAGFDDDSSTPDTTGETSNDPEMEGFDDTNFDSNGSLPVESTESGEGGFFSYFSGKLTQQMAMGYDEIVPQNIFASLRQTIFLDYDRKFENGLKLKINGRAFYDPMYDVSTADYYPAEVDELRYEIWLFEAYLEWNVMENLDAKFGRQVVVWGRSDSIRITDILNPLDFRRPGTLDIENLRLPTTMLKLDYQIDSWRISPIAIVEQRFTKFPPFGSIYYPIKDLPVLYSEYEASGLGLPIISDESYKDVTFAISAEADFKGGDVSFYAARVRQDIGFIDQIQQDGLANSIPQGKDFYVKMQHNKTNMFGTAVNYVTGAWLLKTELAYFSDLTYTSTFDRTLSRTDGLLGLEYRGFSNTTLSYDFSLRHFNQYDDRLYVPLENYLERDTYQQAFRVSSDFVNDTVHLNYLVSAFGEKANEGGFQRAWLDYEFADAINARVGIIDYFGGSSATGRTTLFDRVDKYNILFMDMSYSF